MYCEEDGYLYCFYSDDTGSTASGSHDQTIVYKRSKDGVTWSNAVEVIACTDSRWRAGMPVITKMGNGEYFLVFELVRTDKETAANGSARPSTARQRRIFQAGAIPPITERESNTAKDTISSLRLRVLG